MPRPTANLSGWRLIGVRNTPVLHTHPSSVDQTGVSTMSKRKGGRTAGELLAELERDPEYLRRRAAKDEAFRRIQDHCDEIFRSIPAQLKVAGFPADSLEDLVREIAPMPERVVAILLRHLEDCPEERIQESLVRSLGAAKDSFDGRPLIARFDSTSNEGLRFAILNTIALVRPHSIDNWLERARQNEYLRETLANLGYQW